MNLVAIPPQSVGVMWPQVEPGIERMLAHGIGLHTAQEIKLEAMAGRWMLFVVEDQGRPVMSAVCAIEEGSRKVYSVAFAWGDQMAEWKDDFYAAMIRIATEMGCDSISITGRRGWVKYLKPMGFNERMVTVVKELN